MKYKLRGTNSHSMCAPVAALLVALTILPAHGISYAASEPQHKSGGDTDPHRDPPPGEALTMPSRMAWRTLQETLPKINMYSTGWGPHKATGGKLTPASFSVISSGDKDHNFEFSSFTTYLTAEDRGFIVFGTKSSRLVVLAWDKKNNGVEDARRFVNALNRLIYDTQHGHLPPWSASPAEELADFKQKADTWRALSTKPPLSDEVQKDRLLAEDAVNNRDLIAAANYYEAGDVADPAWAQGWFNAALIYGELHDYTDAADRMKRYVTLVPDAPDIQTAKNNIILWEAKSEDAGRN